MEQFRPQLKKFLTDILFKFSWLIILVLVLTNIFFKPIINIITIPLIVGIIYNAWLTKKNKFVTKLFVDEDFVDNEKPVFWIVTTIEFLILMVGLHFLFKGFSTVTGVSENLFNLQITNFPLSVSFILALAVVIGMLVILYKIKHSSKNKRLILIYILVDIFILFPYNFIFSYENCLKDNISHYYANAMPQLYDKLNTELAKRKEFANDKYRPIETNNQHIKDDVKEIKSEIENENTRYQALNLSEMDEYARRDAQRRHNETIRECNRKIRVRESKINNLVDSLKSNFKKYDTLSYTLNSLSTIVKGINNSKIKKEDLYDSVVNAKKYFIQIYNADTLLSKDTVISNLMNKLQVVTESPTDGFFNLLKDLFSWALKDEYSIHSNTNLKDQGKYLNQAQLEWEDLTPQKRWFSFLFAILIDVFPLIITLCYIHFIKHKRNKTI